MAERVTRCPHCGTSFRINDEQLSSAGGAVRCGSCLQIFRALDHLITGQTSPQKSSIAAPESGAETKASKKLPTQPNNPPTQPAVAKKSNPEVTADDQLISDDMETEEEKEPLFDDDLSDSFLTASRQTNSRTLFDREIRAREDEEDNKDNTDESWAEALLQEIDDDPSPETSTPSPSFASQRFALVPDTDEEVLNRDERPPESTFGNSELAENEHALDHQAMQEMFADAPDTKKLYNRIEPEILELHALPPSTHWKIRWLWPGLCLLAVMCLLGQVAFFQFDNLSRLSPYRSVYGAICPALGCQLPDLIDVDKVRTYNLVMRAHPQQKNALIVDALLINNAAYQQPFPQLTLEFSNIQGQLMAGRHFAPAEYLGGEMAGNNLMPINQPIHISLEIVRPDSAAVNYTLSPTQ